MQGVGFRMSLYYAAKRLAVTGWVRNRADGKVEAMVQGQEKEVNEFIAWAHKGPGAARVDRVDVSEGSGDYERFDIKAG